MASAASPASPRPIPAALKSVLESEVQKQEGRENSRLKLSFVWINCV